jgi:hypothetical protein
MKIKKFHKIQIFRLIYCTFYGNKLLTDPKSECVWWLTLTTKLKICGISKFPKILPSMTFRGQNWPSNLQKMLIFGTSKQFFTRKSTISPYKPISNFYWTKVLSSLPYATLKTLVFSNKITTFQYPLSSNCIPCKSNTHYCSLTFEFIAVLAKLWIFPPFWFFIKVVLRF